MSQSSGKDEPNETRVRMLSGRSVLSSTSTTSSDNDDETNLLANNDVSK